MRLGWCARTRSLSTLGPNRHPLKLGPLRSPQKYNIASIPLTRSSFLYAGFPWISPFKVYAPRMMLPTTPGAHPLSKLCH